MYGKIYECTFTGSMMGKGSTVFAVWGYIIAHTGPDSLVEVNPNLLAILLGEKENEVNEAITYLEAPDPMSRSKGHEGRRLIKRGEFLYFVPQASKYRGLPNDRARKEYFAEKQREHRERLTSSQTVKSKGSNSVKECQTSNNACAYAFVSSLPEGVRGRFEEWIPIRKAMRKCKNWEAMFEKQVEWLKQFTTSDQIEIIDQSIRNGWQGLFRPKKDKQPWEEKKPDPNQMRLDRDYEESRKKWAASKNTTSE